MVLIACACGSGCVLVLVLKGEEKVECCILVRTLMAMHSRGELFAMPMANQVRQKET